MRPTLSLAIAFSVALTATAPAIARADTVIPGGNVVNQTWTPAGSPYVVQGDVTVPAGAYLHVEAGTTIQFASGDLMGSGLDTARVELTVIGSLRVSGTAAAPVRFESQSATVANAWYGIVVGAAAEEATVTGALVRHAVRGLSSWAGGTVLSLQGSTFQTNGTGVRILAGSPAVSGVRVTGCQTGVSVEGGTGVTLSNLVVAQCAGTGISMAVPSGVGSLTVTNSTIHGNYVGVSVAAGSGATATANVVNTIVTQSSGYGIYRDPFSGITSVQVRYSDVWGNATNFYNVSAGAGSISANPLFASAPTDLALTANSPCRFAGETGGDLGALPYAGAPTSLLQGTLWTDTTLAAGTHAVAGDLTVPAGRTLTLAPGATLAFASSDGMMAGLDVARIELTVNGSLRVDGTAAEPVLLASQSSTSANAWYGVVVGAAAAEARLAGAVIRHASRALTSSAGGGVLSIRDSTFETSGTGIRILAGGPLVDGVTVRGCLTGVSVEGGSGATLSNAVIAQNAGTGIAFALNFATGTLAIVNATIHGNQVGVSVAAGTGATAAATLVNSIVTGSSSYGIHRDTSTGSTSVQVLYSDVWGNGTNYYLVSAGTGSISANPLYVAAPADLRLQPGSVCIDAGTATGAPATDRNGALRPIDGDGILGAAVDIGAYEFAPEHFCGDGVVDAGEACDDGALNGTYGRCLPDCSGLGEHCGDGVPNGPEACDDGNASNTDACLTTCLAASCGDGYLHAGVEDCDDGNPSNADACLTSCVAASCGDGFVQEGVEPCDDGNASNTDACLTTCVAASCGDGFVREGVEACDDGNAENGDACRNDCALPSCGDGVVQAGVEACDDGNASNADACLTTCVAASCGDGFVREGVEACDDGNLSNADACLTTCAAASCGDGYVREGVEGCDDGNDVDADLCTQLCTSAACGDGVKQAWEACDDGNASSTDACLVTCLAASCGDGFVHAGVEECDDGNGAAGDGCAPGCTLESSGGGGGGGCGTPGAAAGSLTALLALAALRRGRSGRAPRC